MASRSKDYIFHKSGVKSGPDSSPDSVHESEAVPDCEDRNAGEVEETISPDSTGLPEAAQPDAETQAAPAASPDPGEEAAGEDEELLEMLEQLSDTIDTAHTVLAGQHEIASNALDPAPPAPSEFLPPPPPTPPAKRNRALPLLAASAGVVLGVGALAAFWMLWKSPPAGDSGKLAKTQDRATQTFVSRSPLSATVTPRIRDDPPATPEARVSPEQASTAPPSPAQASLAPPPEPEEPPGDEPAAMTEAVAVVPKAPAKVAVIPKEKKPELPPLPEDEEAQILARGKMLTATGDVAAARLAYDYAARRKSVESMFALAQTYDPEMLAAWSVVGIQPDMRAAMRTQRVCEAVLDSAKQGGWVEIPG